MRLALFDFDGTLTTGDTLFPFLKFAGGTTRFYSGLLIAAPSLVGYVAGITPAWKPKQALIAYVLKGRTRQEIEALGEQFCQQVLPDMLRLEAMDRLQWHRNQGHDIYVVSASTDAWLLPFCNRENIGLICTELEYRQDVFTGRLATPNCKGREKVNRIQQQLDLSDYNRIYAYGDSNSGDMPMLQLADEAFFRKFV